MFSQSRIFFLPDGRRVLAVFPHGGSMPLKVEPKERRADGGPVARRLLGAKWTFRKGPFFSREHRR